MPDFFRDLQTTPAFSTQMPEPRAQRISAPGPEYPLKWTTTSDRPDRPHSIPGSRTASCRLFSFHGTPCGRFCCRVPSPRLSFPPRSSRAQRPPLLPEDFPYSIERNSSRCPVLLYSISRRSPRFFFWSRSALSDGKIRIPGFALQKLSRCRSQTVNGSGT